MIQCKKAHTLSFLSSTKSPSYPWETCSNVYTGAMHMSKSWCAWLHATSTWEHIKWSFWNLLHSHHNWSNRTKNRPIGWISIECSISSTINPVFLLSKVSTLWVLSLFASSNVFVCIFKYLCWHFRVDMTSYNHGCHILTYMYEEFGTTDVYCHVQWKDWKVLIFLSTKLIDLKKFVVIYPYHWSLSHAIVNFTLEESSNHCVTLLFPAFSMFCNSIRCECVTNTFKKLEKSVKQIMKLIRKEIKEFYPYSQHLS